MAIGRIVSRRAGIIAFLAILVGSLTSLRAQQLPSSAVYVAGELIVQFKAGVDEGRRAEIRAAHAATLVRGYNELRMERLAIPSAANPIALAQAFSSHPEVEAAQPNFVRQAISFDSPNDPYYGDGSLWGLAKINASGAWSAFGPGTDTVVVADIDTGVDYNHPDLAGHMWKNPREIDANGVDDDQNGYVDDVYGINAVRNDGNPADDHYHGTHTSGTFGAVSDNGYGIAGIAGNVKILACKFITAQNTGTDADAIECFNYVIALKQRGENIRVTSNSWGGMRDAYFPTALKNAIDAAGNAGILNVFAAGNDGVNIDVTPFDPASFTSPSIVSVAASDSNDARASWSNYGAASVDLAAPGVNILSTYLGGGYAWASGTSMATPHVAGVAALLLSNRPAMTVSEAKDALLNSVDTLAQWNGVVASGGRLNAYQALNAGSLPVNDPPPVNEPPQVSLLTPGDGASVIVGAVVNVTATASDTDGISRVDFYAGSTFIGSASAAPYGVQWRPTQQGTISLTARAFDSAQNAATSAPVRVRVKRK